MEEAYVILSLLLLVLFFSKINKYFLSIFHSLEKLKPKNLMSDELNLVGEKSI